MAGRIFWAAYALLLLATSVSARYPSGPVSCDKDPTCTPKISTFREPGCVFLYFLWVLFFVCVSVWMAMRRAMSSHRKAITVEDQVLGDTISHKDMDGNVDFDDGDIVQPTLKRRTSSFVAGVDETELQDLKKLPHDAGETPRVGDDFHGAGGGDDDKPRRSQEKLIRTPSGGDSSVVPGNGAEEVHLDILSDPPSMLLRGYKTNLVGTICFGGYVALSLLWFIIYLVILYDYYVDCEVFGVDALCFFGDYRIFGNYDTNSEVLFFLWVVMLFWFGSMLVTADRLKNWFRVPCAPADATYVWVWVRDEEEVLMSNVSWLMTRVRSFRAHWFAEVRSGHSGTVPVLRTEEGTRYFLFDCTRYLLNPDGRCVPAVASAGSTYAEISAGGKSGLARQTHQHRLDQIGQNKIPFKVDTIAEAIHKEFFSFFYLYQMMVYIVWVWFSYLLISLILLSVVIGSGAFNIYVSRKNQKSIKSMTDYETRVFVLRDGEWAESSSIDLVPGDVLRVRSGWVLPCDLALYRGACVCDESGLTGESMPVRKTPLPEDQPNKEYIATRDGAKHTLFAGTTVLQAGNDSSEEVIAIVTETGISTSKGELISNILFPTRMTFKYDEELRVVFGVLFVYGLLCFIFAVKFQLMNGSQSGWPTKWVYGVFTVSQILSPLLPVTLVVGQHTSSRRLETKGVFCLNPHRIAIAGKVRVYCFDKTGTLTKEGLDFLGIRTVSEHFFSAMPPLGTEFNMNAQPVPVRWALATCHAVTRFGDDLVGNQVEVKMFSATGWELIEEPGRHPRVGAPQSQRKSADDGLLEIVRRFEFDHGRMTMSVIVRDAEGNSHVFCKGSFEKTQELCEEVTLPEGYLDTAQGHAADGCYVLGIGHRKLGPVDDEAIANMTRDEVEKGLSFLGLLLFRNELKPDTRQAIDHLNRGDVHNVMITGDNAQCGAYIARKGGLVNPTKPIFLGDKFPDQKEVTWTRVRPTEEESDTDVGQVTTARLLGSSELRSQIELAVTGRAFDTLNGTGGMPGLMLNTRIFARMSPDNKVQAVSLFVDKGLVVGMCGDGGNDCGALRTAHVGVALSEAEASVVSPFTSKTKSVQSVVDLLLEGRCALATSFSCYKFMITYGQLFSVLKLVCFYFGVIMCEMDYCFIDGVVVISLSYVMTLSKPNEELNTQRPTSSLLGPSTMASACGMQFINFIFLVSALSMMKDQKDFVPWPAKLATGSDWWLLGDNWETTFIFSTVILQFITSAGVFSFGWHYRKPIWTNWPLCFCVIFLYLFCMGLLLGEPTDVSKAFHIASEAFNAPGTTSGVWAAYQAAGNPPSPAMSVGLRWSLFFLIFTNNVLVIAWEKLVVQGWVRRWVQRRFPSSGIKFDS